MFKLISKILVIFLFFTVSTRSQEFDNVLINGNVRISNETILVFSELPSEQFLDENSINTVLKKLYESGFFKDVVVKIENRNLIIDVIENPIIQTVFVEGIKKKKTIEAIYDILLLKNRSSFNSITVKNDERINILMKKEMKIKKDNLIVSLLILLSEYRIFWFTILFGLTSLNISINEAFRRI